MKLITQRVQDPYLKYRVQAWNSWLQYYIESLQNNQCRVVKAVSGLQVSEDKLSSLNTLSLQIEHLCRDMIETLKLLHKLGDRDPSKCCTSASSYHNHATKNSTVSTKNIAAPSYGLIKGSSLNFSLLLTQSSVSVEHDPCSSEEWQITNQFKDQL